MGLPASAVVGVNLDPKQRDQALAEIAKLDQVRSIQEVTGRFDAFVTLRARTIEEIYKIVRREPRKGPRRQPGRDVHPGREDTACVKFRIANNPAPLKFYYSARGRRRESTWTPSS